MAAGDPVSGSEQIERGKHGRRQLSGCLVSFGAAIFLVGMLLPWITFNVRAGFSINETAFQLGRNGTFEVGGLALVVLEGLLLLAGLGLLLFKRRGFQSIHLPVAALAVAMTLGGSLVAEWRYITHLLAAAPGPSPSLISADLGWGFLLSAVAVVIAVVGSVIAISAASTTSADAFARWIQDPGKQTTRA